MSQSQPPADLPRINPEEALRNGWLELWYQPKIDLETMSVCGAEALVRLRHPEHGIVPPDLFLPPAGSAFYDPLTKYVIRQAMAHWEHFAAQGHPLKLAVNVTLTALQSPKFAEFACQCLPQKPTFPGLILEVTEGEVIPDPEKVRDVAFQLKLHKIDLSIDDFGSAHSSPARLRDIPAVELKLDRSYVTGCATDAAKQAVCVAAVELAYGFGLTVCAEGIETIEDLRTVIGFGCQTAQGFLFARPMMPVQLIRTLSRRSGGGIVQACEPEPHKRKTH